MTDILKAADVIDALIEANPDKVEQMLSKHQLAGWFVGQAMKKMNGEADPAHILTVLRTRLDALAHF